jgi:tRNA (adenine37-N6)-methyltransferase
MMLPIQYRPIGVVESPIRALLRPEEMRSAPARLVLEPRFTPAAAELEAGQHLWVTYHLHRIAPVPGKPPEDLFTRRIPVRPNPIGITLVRVVSVEGATITVVGLDAVDGTPILDLKPYQPVWDEPPVQPQERQIDRRAVIVLTGGPGGGKSTLIEDLRRDPEWAGRFVTLPEAVQYARFINILPTEKLFQRAIVQLQIGLEEGLRRMLDPDDPRPIICHRGSLDPLAYWLQRGWQEDEFFLFAGLSRAEFYQRYKAVIHLVTAADGAPARYTHWPEAHRPEEMDEAIQLDRWLGKAWGMHPHYYRLDNTGKDWESKSRAARKILADYLQSSIK